MDAARLRQQRLTKPPGSLGRLEDLAIQVAGVLSAERPVIRGKALIIAAADHGVAAEGVSGYPQEVTAQMVQNFLAGGAAINAMARLAGVELTIVNAGIAGPLPHHPRVAQCVDSSRHRQHGARSRDVTSASRALRSGGSHAGN